MPVPVASSTDIQPGEIYEDAFYHPCLCVSVENTKVMGISLVDGTYPRLTDFRKTEVRKLTSDEAWQWRQSGPPDAVLIESQRWWSAPSSREARNGKDRTIRAVWVT